MNILTLAAYERARRALRGECEPNSRAGKMLTNISNKPSANIVKMREVGSRPRRLRQNKKRPSQNGLFLVEAAGKQVIKQLITVFHDAPEQNKELKEGVNLRRATTMFASRRRTLVRVPLKIRKRTALEDNPLILVEAAGLEPTVSSTRNWRDTTFATPRKILVYARTALLLRCATGYKA